LNSWNGNGEIRVNKKLPVLCLGAALASLALAATATAHPNSRKLTAAVNAANASRLPGDSMPVPGVRTPLPDLAPGPTLAQATAAAQAALAACAAEGLKVSASIIDTAGEPRIVLVADGMLGRISYLTLRKALTALAFNMRTSEIAAKMANDPTYAARLKPYMLTWSGGVPLVVAGKTIGAIGVGGASGDQDEECAKAGAAAIAD
jgi:uncharacterized protein GlcG (DUF336 family)